MSQETKDRITWRSAVPTQCQATGLAIIDTFIEGRTVTGAWAIMHPTGHKLYGCGLGNGRGQKYTRQEDGTWLRTEG